MRILEQVGLDFKDVLLVPKVSRLASRQEVILEREFKFLHSPQKLTCIPIMNSNLDTTGGLKIAAKMAAFGLLGVLSKHLDLKQIFLALSMYPNKIFYTMGIRDSDWDKLIEYCRKYEKPNLVCMDIANFYCIPLLDNVKKLRELLPNAIIMAGNICTPEMVEHLTFNGVDIIKVGIGPGENCKTREVTGVGYPQLSAIIECASAAHGLDSLIVADGGMKTSGDVCKAFAAGSDFIMSASLFNGCDECDGEWRFNSENCKEQLLTYGMSSKRAMSLYGGIDKTYRTSEGNEGTWVNYKGTLKDIVQDLLGALRSSMTYTGARRIKDMNKTATFIKVY